MKQGNTIAGLPSSLKDCDILTISALMRCDDWSILEMLMKEGILTIPNCPKCNLNCLSFKSTHILAKKKSPDKVPRACLFLRCRRCNQYGASIFKDTVFQNSNKTPKQILSFFFVHVVWYQKFRFNYQTHEVYQ